MMRSTVYGIEICAARNGLGPLYFGTRNSPKLSLRKFDNFFALEQSIKWTGIHFLKFVITIDIFSNVWREIPTTQNQLISLAEQHKCGRTGRSFVSA